MEFGEWEKRIDNRISEEILQEFYDAAECCDTEKMNRLHQEWHMFFDNPDEEETVIYAKVEDGVMTLPKQMIEIINAEVRYKWILKDTGTLYLMEDNPKTKYVEDAVKTSSGNCIDEGFMYLKNTVIFDDTMQNVFNWRDEDVAVIRIFMDSIRVDKF